MRKTSITAITIAAAGAALLASATAASASPHPAPGTVHARTYVTGRPDGGNGGYWANDTYTRDLTITRTGGTPGDYTFTATLADKGTFRAIKGALTPNQGPGDAGDVIKSAVTGPMQGGADFTFTASQLPTAAPNAGVPGFENDHGHAPADSTSTWYELAFPAGTTFGGAGIGDWSWKYDATVKTVTFKIVWVSVWHQGWGHYRWLRVREVVPVVHVTHQHWTDASGNGDGNLPGDGNITG